MVTNKLGVISGGTKGLGKAAALYLAKQCDLALIYNNDIISAEETKKEILAIQGEKFSVRIYKCDVSILSEVLLTQAKIVSDFQKEASILINSAAVSIVNLFILDDIINQKKSMDVNYFGVVHMCKAFLPGMHRLKFGRIINLSSNAVSVNIRGLSAYCASKAALEKFSQILGGEVARSGITVNVIRPGISDTNMSKEYIKDLEVNRLKELLMPSGELIEASEIAMAVQYLIDSRQVNSSILTVDSGHAHFQRN